MTETTDLLLDWATRRLAEKDADLTRARRWAARWKRSAEENRFYAEQAGRTVAYLYDRMVVARRWAKAWKQEAGDYRALFNSIRRTR